MIDRQLTKEQEDFVLRVNSETFRAEALKNQQDDAALMQAAIAERDRLLATQRAAYEKLVRERAEAIRPLKEALRAAGITLQLTSYEGVWGWYRLGNGPVVDIDVEDTLDTYEEGEC